MLPYIPVMLLCSAQFFRPTLFGWGIITLGFLAYAIGVCAYWNRLDASDLLVFLSIGLVPSAMLFWAWPPKRAEQN